MSSPHRFVDPADYRLAQKKINKIRIELRSAPFANGFYCLTQASRRAIASPMRDRIEAVCDRDDSRLQRDSFPLETARIALSIPTLVVRSHTNAQIRIECAQWVENFSTTLWMGSHGSAFFRGEFGGLMEDVSQSFVQLPDVVEQRDALDAAQSVLVEAGGLTENQRIGRNPTNVFPRLLVVGVDRVQQRLHGRCSESLGPGSSGVLAVEKSAGGDGD